MRALHDQLRVNAERTPDAVAVAMGDERVSYAALERRSDQVAALLQQLGVGRGDLVPVCAGKSVSVPAAWLGVLKTGAAYVPLDPSWPLARIEAIARSSRFRALIADPAWPAAAACHDALGIPVVWTGPGPLPGPTIDAAAGEQPRPVDVDGTDTAYVYFTSGSTGQPKGAVISHRAALCYLDAADRILDLGRDDVVAGHSPLAFDLSSFELHFALSRGASVALIGERTAMMPGSLVSLLHEQRPTVLYMVPSALNRLAALSSLATERLPSVRALIFAGEAPRIAALRSLRPVFPAATFHHWYGSTEAALVTAARFPPSQPLPEPLSIGGAVSGVELALLTDGGEIAPAQDGAAGELLVRGGLVFDGYDRDPDATSAAFLSTDSGGDWFRTGDIVRADRADELYYVNRRDRMVKVKGTRVDLGEVEAALLRVPGVRDCAVVVGAIDPLLGSRLHAFIVAAPPLDPGAIRSALALELPTKLIPDKLHLPAQLPRTSSGKIDRVALAAIAGADPETTR